MPKKFWVLAGIVLLAVLFFVFTNSKSEPLKFEQVSRGSVKSTVSGSGTLTGKDSASLRFLGSGKLSFLNYKTGDSVGKGRAVAGLDTRDLALGVQQAESDLRSKQASAEKALDDVKGHDKDETPAQKETRTAAEANRDEAVSQLNRARAALAQSVIITPISGTITQANFYPGQFISSTETVVKIVDWSSVYFDAEIDEADISQIAVGQKAKVSLNSYPDDTFDGTVEEIIPQTHETMSGSTVVKVRINLGNPQIVLVDGLNGQVNIVTRKSDNTLVISRDSLREDNMVLVSRGKRIEAVGVNVGIESDEQVEVASGVNEGDFVVTNPSNYKEPNWIVGHFQQYGPSTHSVK